MKSLNIQSLTLKNYRCFQDIRINFDDKMTVLVATNGAGKTSILDAIAVALGPYVGAFDEGVGTHFQPSDIRLFQARKTASNEMEYASGGVSLEATGWIPGSIEDAVDIEASWKRSLVGPTKVKTTVRDAKNLIDYGKRQQDAVRTPDVDTLLPLLAYYGTGRLWQQKKLTLGKLPRTSRTIGYSDCLHPASSYKSLVEWFRYWSTNSLKASEAAREAGTKYEKTEFDHYVESVSNAVNVCLESAGWRNMTYSFAREELVAHHEQHGELPVELLSDGIRNMLGLVADIAFRATKLNPQLGADAAKKTPGIVLIDEVDMHLHPRWQQTVLEQLRKAFPEVQFIVTTHSPQVLSTVPSEQIRILVDGQIHSAPPGTEGAEPGRLLKQVLGLEDTRPVANEAVKELKEYLQLVDSDQWKEPRARELRAILDRRYQGSEPSLLEADIQIENREWELNG